MPLGNAIRKSLGGAAVDVTGRTTLRQTAALLKKCDLYVGNDTGSMHLAAAAGIPVVEISCFPMDGPVWHWNSPRRFAPWGVPHRILQPKGNAPCCLRWCGLRGQLLRRLGFSEDGARCASIRV